MVHRFIYRMKEFYKKGLNFKCQGSGKCCVSRGEYGNVYLTKSDKVAMAKYLKLSVKQFLKKYCEVTDGVLHLIQPKNTDDCIFLEKNRCTVYGARPTQCRTWPFWPENMNPKAWKKNVVAFCPGASVRTKESLVPFEKIQKQVEKQRISEKELTGELS